MRGMSTTDKAAITAISVLTIACLILVPLVGAAAFVPLVVGWCAFWALSDVL